MKTGKLNVNIENLLQMIDFLPNSSEDPQWVTYKVIHSDGQEYIGSQVNWAACREVIHHSPEQKSIKKRAQMELEGLYNYITMGTYSLDDKKEQIAAIKRLIRLTIIAY